MMTPEQELQWRKGYDDGRPCINCEHPPHDNYCYEGAWTNPETGYVELECMCPQYVPMDAGDVLERENPERI